MCWGTLGRSTSRRNTRRSIGCSSTRRWWRSATRSRSSTRWIWTQRTPTMRSRRRLLAAAKRRARAAQRATEARRSQQRTPGQRVLSLAAPPSRTTARKRSPATTEAAAWRLPLCHAVTSSLQTTARTATKPQCWIWTRMWWPRWRTATSTRIAIVTRSSAARARSPRPRNGRLSSVVAYPTLKKYRILQRLAKGRNARTVPTPTRTTQTRLTSPTWSPSSARGFQGCWADRRTWNISVANRSLPVWEHGPGRLWHFESNTLF